ncbi:MAG: hypothetical protein HY690_01295 [Chloroflexi bacterium]|nr:hypothetical protein [Chloroflexota bacterium]
MHARFSRTMVAVLLAWILALVSVVGAAANNDPKSPGDDCSGNPVAIGQPPDPFGAPNATDIVDIVRGTPNPVDGPASANNPGVATGARGQEHHNGGVRCP